MCRLVPVFSFRAILTSPGGPPPYARAEWLVNARRLPYFPVFEDARELFHAVLWVVFFFDPFGARGDVPLRVLTLIESYPAARPYCR